LFITTYNGRAKTKVGLVRAMRGVSNIKYINKIIFVGYFPANKKKKIGTNLITKSLYSIFSLKKRYFFIIMLFFEFHIVKIGFG